MITHWNTLPNNNKPFLDHNEFIFSFQNLSRQEEKSSKACVIRNVLIPSTFSHIAGYKHNYDRNQKCLLIFSTSHEWNSSGCTRVFLWLWQVQTFVLLSTRRPSNTITLRCIITLPRLDNMHAAPFNQAAIKRIFLLILSSL